jgi:hypothetical protein
MWGQEAGERIGRAGFDLLPLLLLYCCLAPLLLHCCFLPKHATLPPSPVEPLQHCILSQVELIHQDHVAALHGLPPGQQGRGARSSGGQ